MYVCIHTYTQTFQVMRAYTFTCVCVCVCVRARARMRVYACMHVCMYVCRHVFLHVCMYSDNYLLSQLYCSIRLHYLCGCLGVQSRRILTYPGDTHTRRALRGGTCDTPPRRGKHVLVCQSFRGGVGVEVTVTEATTDRHAGPEACVCILGIHRIGYTCWVYIELGIYVGYT